MSNRLRRKSRPQADVELQGGPLNQRSFRGGVNKDQPASEIGDNQLANAENVICFERYLEARPGTRLVDQGTMVGSGTYHAFVNNTSAQGGGYASAQYIMHRGTQLWRLPNPIVHTSAGEILGATYDLANDVVLVANTDSTIRPFRKGSLIFNTAGILYYESGETAFRINAPNPIYGLPDDIVDTPTYERRYLVTLSRIASGSTRAAGGLLHESGTNPAQYFDTGAEDTVYRTPDYATVYKSTAWGPGDGKTYTAEELKTIFSSLDVANDDSAAKHFTHVSIYGTLSLGDNSLDPETNKGNSRNTYVWMEDVSRSGILGDTAQFVDVFTDEELRDRLNAGLILQSRGFVPLPNGSAGEATPGFIFVADRTPESANDSVYYSQVDSTPWHMGYYFPGSQYKEFGDSISALRAIGDILSVFTAGSTHTCTLTAWTEIGTLQSVLTLTHWVAADETMGVRDWGTISQVDKGTIIAVCSDATVRMWDSNQWGEDLSYDSVNSEIVKIVPANPNNLTTGSFGIFYKGAYYLFYSKNSADTYLSNCLRLGFGKRAGFGWTFYTNWITIPFRCGVTTVVDNVNRLHRLLGINIAAVSGGFAADSIYWLESYHSYLTPTELEYSLGRVDLDGVASGLAGSSTGLPIACTVLFREMTAAEESEALIHQETHVYMRPLFESTGYISGLTVNLAAYVNGSATAAASRTDVPKTGDLHFLSEVSGQRIQLGLTTTAGQHRIVGIDSHCRSLDRINYATAGDNTDAENTDNEIHMQKALSSDLVHWFTRRNYQSDRGTGRRLTGTPAMVTGPDTASSSAYSMAANTLVGPAGYTSLTDDFTILFALKGLNVDGTGGNLIHIAGATPISLAVNNTGVVRFTSSLSASTFTVPASYDDSVWTFCILERDGTNLTLYFTTAADAVGASSTIVVATTTVGGGIVTLGSAGFTGLLFDVRVYNKALTAAQRAFWRSDIVDDLGIHILPMV